MAIDIMQPIRFSIDLGSGLVQTPLRMQLMKGDKKANRVIVVLTDGGKEADLTGVTVSGSFIRPGDAAEIPLAGTAEGNRAIVVLDDACYAQEGYCEINVALTMGGTKRTIVALTGNVLSKGSGAYVDVSGVIPSLDDIIAQYAEMKRVTEETQEAANAATTAASKAPYVNPTSKNWMIWDASARKYVDSGVTAKGEPGPQGPPGQNGTGSGTVTGVKVDEQTYQPDSAGVVTLPKMGGGAEIDDAEPSGNKTYSSQKVESIASQLSQQKVDKANWTAGKNVVTDADGKITTEDKPTALKNPNALTINGQSYDGSEEVEVNVEGGGGALYTNLADNSDFEHWVAQAGIGANHGTQAYGGDRWILTDGTISNYTENDDGSGFSGITLNGTLVQVVPSPPSVATAFVNMVSGTAEISYDATAGEIVLTSAGGVIKNVMLLEGEWTEKPEYVSKGFSAEFFECAKYGRFYWSTGAASMFYGFSIETNKILLLFQFAPQLRCVPSIFCKDLFARFNTGSNLAPLNTDGSATRTPGTIACVLTTTGAQSTGACMVGLLNKDAYIQFAADLPRR